MFTTNSVNATIKIYDDWATAYVEEWFGKNAKFYEKDNEVYCTVKGSLEVVLGFWKSVNKEEILKKYFVPK